MNRPHNHHSIPGPFNITPQSTCTPLSVRLLVSGSGTWTTELLWLALSAVGNQQGSVVLDKGALQLVLGVLVDIFLVVGDNRLGDGLSDGVDLRSVTTTGDAHSDIDTCELIGSDDQEGLVDLVL